MKINVETLTGSIVQKEVEEFVSRYPQVEAWLRIKAERTQRNYARYLMRYLRTLEQNGIAETPQDLYDLVKDDGEYTTNHVSVLEEFQISCEDAFPEGERSRIYNITIGIKSFYSFKGRFYQIPKGRAEYYFTRKKPKTVPKLEEVIPYIDTIPHLRNKMIVALETSAPFRLESLTMLKWKHYKEDLEDKELPHVFLKAKEMKGKGRGAYRKIEQHCFLTPFSKDYVLRWKNEYEVLRGEKISLDNPECLELPFLVCYKGETKGEKLTYGGLNQIFDRCKSNRFPFTLHVWRTFVNEALKKARFLKEDRDVILGHKPDRTEDAYSKLNLQRLRREFRKAVRFLDPTFKTDERAEKLRKLLKQKKGIKISNEEAREIIDNVAMEFVTKLSRQN